MVEGDPIQTGSWMDVVGECDAVVNLAGMCCTTTMAGDARGSAESTSSSAWVPPVEVPMATTRSVGCLIARAGLGLRFTRSF